MGHLRSLRVVGKTRDFRTHFALSSTAIALFYHHFFVWGKIFAGDVSGILNRHSLSAQTRSQCIDFKLKPQRYISKSVNWVTRASGTYRLKSICTRMHASFTIIFHLRCCIRIYMKGIKGLHFNFCIELAAFIAFNFLGMMSHSRCANYINKIISSIFHRLT